MQPEKKRQAFVVNGFVDMRKQINGLTKIVQDASPEATFSGSYYLFMGKTRRIMKILYWDASGFCLWQKRLEEAKFPWPQAGESINPLLRENLLLILKGIDVWKAHRKLNYTRVA
jgi:transposase